MSTTPAAHKKETVRKSKDSSRVSTQRYVQFAGAQDGILVLKNGGLRAVLEVSSINFNLKSEDEQNSIISGYQRFLNALNFPVQLLVRSRKLDIDHYLDNLRGRMGKLDNTLLQKQMSEYIEYVGKLVEYADIMEKKFFVVIPVNPPRAEKKGLFAQFLSYIRPDDTVMGILQRKKEFQSLKKDLETRMNIVQTGLENSSLQTKQLSTEKIIELFYQAYNPERARLQKFERVEELSVEG